MKVVTGTQMKEIDLRAQQEFGLPGLVLMETAGRSVAQAVARLAGPIVGKRVAILCGPGNNGGDGLVTARYLAAWGARVMIYAATPLERFQGDAMTQVALVRRLGLEIHTVDEGALSRLRLALGMMDVVVDALLGTGARGPLRRPYAQVISTLNELSVPVVAVDIPSGVEADTGKIATDAVRATMTVTFGLPKLGCCIHPGAERTGELIVADIGLAHPLVAAGSGSQIGPIRITSPKEAAQAFPLRATDTHKGTYGRLLLVAGSRGMMGAAILAARAALRCGAGLVTLAVPESQQQVGATAVPEALTLGLSETPNGSIAASALPQLRNHVGAATAVAIGPGISRTPETLAWVRDWLGEITFPLVVDADALMALVETKGERGTFRRSRTPEVAPLVLTPHPGEMAQLLRTSVAQVQADRLGAARKAAEIWHATVVLKGSRSLIAHPDGSVWINWTGNPGMATGGSGDVLTGVLGALLARGQAAPAAVLAGTYLHGLAGDRAASQVGEESLTAGDLVTGLADAVRALQRGLAGPIRFLPDEYEFTVMGSYLAS